MEHSKHLWRALVLVLLGVIGFAVFRLLLIPESYGVYGNFRANDLATQTGKPLEHGDGNDACATCHDEQHDALGSGRHRALFCEGCHGPLSGHIKEVDVIGEMPVVRRMDTCLRCHQHLVARPKDFPQVDPETHLEAMDVEPTDDVCFGCHDPHSPEV